MAELFVVADACKQLGLRAGAILFRNVRVAEADAALRAAIDREAAAVQARFDGAAAVRALPEVQAYQEILRRAGANPKREQPSVERLLTYARKRGTLPAINSLVDAYNLVSLRTLCSLGAHDLDCLTPPITLRLFTGTEAFTPLGSAELQPVQASQFGYVDAAGRVLCRLDVLQADFSKVTPRTRNAVLIVEGTTAHAAATLKQAMQEAAAEVTRACGGTAEIVAGP